MRSRRSTRDYQISRVISSESFSCSSMKQSETERERERGKSFCRPRLRRDEKNSIEAMNESNDNRSRTRDAGPESRAQTFELPCRTAHKPRSHSTKSSRTGIRNTDEDDARPDGSGRHFPREGSSNRRRRAALPGCRIDCRQSSAQTYTFPVTLPSYLNTKRRTVSRPGQFDRSTNSLHRTLYGIR